MISELCEEIAAAGTCLTLIWLWRVLDLHAINCHIRLINCGIIEWYFRNIQYDEMHCLTGFANKIKIKSSSSCDFLRCILNWRKCIEIIYSYWLGHKIGLVTMRDWFDCQLGVLFALLFLRPNLFCQVTNEFSQQNIFLNSISNIHPLKSTYIYISSARMLQPKAYSTCVQYPE